MKKNIMLLVMLVATSSFYAKTTIEQLKVYTWDAAMLNNAREKALKGDESIKKALGNILKKADKMLTERNVAVTDKSEYALRISKADPHDYVSSSIYFWPDSTNENNPWKRIDGKFNIEFQNKFDFPVRAEMINRITNLTLAWWFTNKKEYAQKAVEQIKVWFINKETFMNPNLERAQFVPNDPKRGWGSCYGILDAERFSNVLNCVGMLKFSGEWSDKDNKELQNWYVQFNKWLMESKNGKEESIQLNNHGVSYDVTLGSGLLFVNDTASARKLFTEAKTKRIDVQIEPDGSMPRELARAGSFHYTCVNLDAFTRLALVAEKANVDLWNYQSADGRSIKNAFRFTYPYLNGTKKWEFRESVEPKKMFEPYWQASSRIPEAKEVLKQNILPALTPDYAKYNMLSALFPLNL